MEKIQSSVLISKPAEDIFAFLSAPENHARFIPGMLEFAKTSPGSFAEAGATARGVRRFLGIKMVIPYEVTEVEPDSRLGMKGSMGPISFEDGYVLDPLGASTRVKFWLQPTLTGLAKLARPLVAQIGKTHAAETLDGLKKALEGTG